MPTFPQDAARPTQAPAPVDTKLTQAPGRLTGTVFCSDTHKPARGAFVELVHIITPGHKLLGNERQYQAIVGADGTYLFDRVIPGEYAIFASLYGYLRAGDEAKAHTEASVYFPQPNSSVTVGAAESAQHDITLDRGAALSGKVLFSDGAPAIRADIFVEIADAKSSPAYEKLGDPNAFARVALPGYFSANDQGIFRVAGLAPGRYLVGATPKLQYDGDYLRDFEFASLGFYSPGVIHRGQATVYEVKAGDEVRDIVVDVSLDAMHSVGGEIRSKDGQLINTCVLTLSDTEDPSVFFRVQGSSTGTFLFLNVPTGTYKMVVTQAFHGVPNEKYKRFDEEDLPLKRISAFADATLTVIVKEADVMDLSLTLNSAPMPPEKYPHRDDD